MVVRISHQGATSLSLRIFLCIHFCCRCRYQVEEAERVEDMEHRGLARHLAKSQLRFPGLA